MCLVLLLKPKKGQWMLVTLPFMKGPKGPKRDQKRVPLGLGLVLVGLHETRTSRCEMGALGPAPAGVPPTVNDTLRATQETSRRHRLMSGGRTSMERGEG